MTDKELLKELRFNLRCYRGEISIGRNRPNDLASVDAVLVRLDAAIAAEEGWRPIESARCNGRGIAKEGAMVDVKSYAASLCFALRDANDNPDLEAKAMVDTLQAVAEAAAREERERCAKVCEAADKSTHPATLADMIRALK